jgi:hypothetical protein
MHEGRDEPVPWFGRSVRADRPYRESARQLSRSSGRRVCGRGGHRLRPGHSDSRNYGHPSPALTGRSAATRECPTASQVGVALLPLGLGPALKRPSGFHPAGDYIALLLAFGTYRTPIADQPIVPNRSRSIIRLKKRALPCSGSRRWSTRWCRMGDRASGIRPADLTRGCPSAAHAPSQPSWPPRCRRG